MQSGSTFKALHVPAHVSCHSHIVCHALAPQAPSAALDIVVVGTHASNTLDLTVVAINTAFLQLLIPHPSPLIPNH